MLSTNDSLQSPDATVTNSSYNIPPTPNHPYTPTPTPNITLPHDTPKDTSCKTTFQYLSNDDKFKARKRMDLSDGFPFIEPSDSNNNNKIKTQIIEVISDSLLLPKSNLKQPLIIVNENEEEKNESNNNNAFNVKNLKITIPKKEQVPSNTNNSVKFNKFQNNKIFQNNY